MKISERQPWFWLDVIATREALPGGDAAKSSAAEAMMRHLDKPSPEFCRAMYDAGYDVTR